MFLLLLYLGRLKQSFSKHWSRPDPNEKFNLPMAKYTCAVPNHVSNGWGREKVSFLDLFVVWENFPWGDATHVTCPGVHDGRSTDTKAQLDELMSILLWAIYMGEEHFTAAEMTCRQALQEVGECPWQVVNLFHAACWFLLFLKC